MIRFGAPLLFVLIWSTGFVVARVAAPHADLQLFLALRFTLTAAVMGLTALVAGAKWPRGRELWPHVLAGALMQGVYLSASYWAIARGLAVGVMALLGALQPLFTALFMVATRRTKLASRAWSGLLIGFGGVGLVLAPTLANGVGSLNGLTVGAALLSVVGGPGLVGCRHNAAHVDDAPWRGNKSDRAPLARAAARSHSGFCFLPRNPGAVSNSRLRAGVGRGTADQIRSITSSQCRLRSLRRRRLIPGICTSAESPREVGNNKVLEAATLDLGGSDLRQLPYCYI